MQDFYKTTPWWRLRLAKGFDEAVVSANALYRFCDEQFFRSASPAGLLNFNVPLDGNYDSEPILQCKAQYVVPLGQYQFELVQAWLNARGRSNLRPPRVVEDVGSQVIRKIWRDWGGLRKVQKEGLQKINFGSIGVAEKEGFDHSDDSKRYLMEYSIFSSIIIK